MLCELSGVAYQRDMSARFSYDDAYHDHYKALEGSPVAERLNAGRCAMLARHAPRGSRVLDFGAGCGTFVRHARGCGFRAMGFDIIPKTVVALKAMDAYADDPAGFDAVTLWDSLEHLAEPQTVLDRIDRGAAALVAIPIFEDLSCIRGSKHYKPDEHLAYFTDAGFVNYMALHGFALLERSTHETDAGREAIGAFAFRKA